MAEEKNNAEEPAAEGEQQAGEEKAAEGAAGAGAEQKVEGAAGGPEPEHMSEDELRRRLEEHFREQKVSDVLVQFLISLSTLAYVKMGITEDTKDHKDLDQASLAIDAFKSLLEAARSRLPEQDAKALEGALASMQVTFAKASER